jgi:thiamine biosynthesis lipoprotein
MSSKPTKLLLLLTLAVCLSAAIWYLRQPDGRKPVRLSGATMGTTWSVVLGTKSAGADPAALQLLLQQQLDLINKQMSTYDPTSEVSRFNDSSSTDWFPVSAETALVVELAQEISRVSDGAFDITVGPLVDLWGFGPKPRSEKRPSDSEIAAARRLVGYRHLQVRRFPAAVRKDIPGLKIDLSAIAKGYAVDKLADVLSSQGIGEMLVEIGGEMLIRGKNPEGKPWRIAVEKPQAGERGIEKIFQLTDTGVATSGNYRNFFVEDGRRYGHTIDPAKGRPVRHRLASVTVLATTSARADALATALMAMGDERAVEFCRHKGVAAYMVLHQGEGTQTVMSDSFRTLAGTGTP